MSCVTLEGSVLYRHATLLSRRSSNVTLFPKKDLGAGRERGGERITKAVSSRIYLAAGVE